jgi:LmbE family N-acetylglucosaminyl deacetylase
MLSDSEVQRALLIAAHPDDIDFSAAGTVAIWTDAGIEVTYCLVTDGDAGGFDDSVPRAEMGPLRRKEQTAAAACVGVHDLRFLGYPDGQVEPSLALRKDLARVIRQVRPDRVLCPSPERNYQRIGIGHPDHRAVGSAALDAVYPDARNPYAFPELRLDEGLEPWTVREVWISAGPTPDHANHFVDITDTFSRKIAALRAHESQTSQREGLADFLRARLARTGEQAGLPAGRLAEAFQVIDTA